MQSQVQVHHPLLGTLSGGPSTWIGHLTPAENLMKEDPKGPDVGFDGVKPSGQGLRGGPLVGDVVVVGKVDVLLQPNTCWVGLGSCPHPSCPHRVDGHRELWGSSWASAAQVLVTAPGAAGGAAFPQMRGGGPERAAQDRDKRAPAPPGWCRSPGGGPM